MPFAVSKSSDASVGDDDDRMSQAGADVLRIDKTTENVSSKKRSPLPSSAQRSQSLPTSPTTVKAATLSPCTKRQNSDSSVSNSDDDNAPVRVSHGRQPSYDENYESKIQELHKVVADMTISRVPSPPPKSEKRSIYSLDTKSEKLSNESNEETSPTDVSARPRLVTHIHAKSASASDIAPPPIFNIKFYPNDSAIISDAEDNFSDSTRAHAPRMVRKKSGELVRSSLKPAGSYRKQRPASMPSTPVYGKNVHFDRKLEHVRHFLHSEKPAAVSANTSPTQEYLGRNDFPFGNDEQNAYELTIELPNFVPEAQQTDNEGAIIKVETVYLSTDKTSLIGRVAVKNLAFNKWVGVRYTMDYWRTTSECAAEYIQDVRRRHRDDNFDRFNFSIRIGDFVGVEDKTMFFCVKYAVAGQEYWDSNGGMNFRVEFHRRLVKKTIRKLTSPIKNPTFRTSEDDMDLVSNDILDQPKHALKSPRSLIFENIYDNHEDRHDEHDDETGRRVAPIKKREVSSDSFSNRYDFSASLTAAIQAANSVLQNTDGEIKKARPKAVSTTGGSSYNPYFSVKPKSLYSSGSIPGTSSPLPQPENKNASNTTSTIPDLIPSTDSSPRASGETSPILGSTSKAPLDSTSYRDFLNNYCFFGTNKVSSSMSTSSGRQLKHSHPQNQSHYVIPDPRSCAIQGTNGSGGSGGKIVSSMPIPNLSMMNVRESSPYATPPYSTSPTRDGSLDVTTNSSPQAYSHPSMGVDLSSFSQQPDYPSSGNSTPVIRI